MFLYMSSSYIKLVQVISRVCRRTNNYFAALLCMSVSSFLLQMNRRPYRHMDLFLVTLKGGSTRFGIPRVAASNEHLRASNFF